MARKGKGKKASNWKGGSFRAAVGGYLRKKARKAKGKPKKVALTAAMRKLLTILNTLVRTDQLWIDPALRSKETAS